MHLFGLCLVLLCVFAFFEFASFPQMDGFLGVPGSTMSHSHGTETPLMTEGSDASVRHPMYRAFILLVLASLLIHPNPSQLMWALFFVITFAGFVPLEESHLLAARGQEYRTYKERTRYRIIPYV